MKVTDKVAVLFGGTSAERKISLLSGRAILRALKSLSIEAYSIDVSKIPIIHLKDNGFNKVFIALHGRGGEDGVIQAVLEFLRIPYTGSGVMASAISIDKLRTKLLWKGSGLPVVAWVLINSSDMIRGLSSFHKNQIVNLGLPVMVKPTKEGSSIGITKVNQLQELNIALKKAFFYDTNVLIEKWIGGLEYTVVILDHQVLPSIRIQYSGGFYDYHSKYISKKTKYFCPSGLSREQEDNLKTLTLTAWNVIGGRGYGRIDVIMDTNHQFYLLEVNTLPGMTNHSLVPLAAQQVGINFPKLVQLILALA
ncbi:MAG: D-alanine--D-alanine ligase [Candidatus Dasytiphilus stammeri]